MGSYKKENEPAKIHGANCPTLPSLCSTTAPHGLQYTTRKSYLHSTYFRRKCTQKQKEHPITHTFTRPVKVVYIPIPTSPSSATLIHHHHHHRLSSTFIDLSHQNPYSLIHDNPSNMRWCATIIAKNSFNTGILQPVMPNVIDPSPSRNLTSILNSLPPIPTPAELPAYSYSPVSPASMNSNPVMVALRNRISACMAPVVFLGESLHNFYGNHLLELPTPLSRAGGMRVVYRSLQQGLTNPPEMNGRAMSVCFIAFGRRIFMSSRVCHNTTDQGVIILRPDRPIIVRLPTAFRSNVGLGALASPLPGLTGPEITIGVTNDCDLTHPVIDIRAPWTGFLSIERQGAHPMFVRASAIKISIEQRARMSGVHRLPPVLSLRNTLRIGVVELVELISLPSVEWLGVFLLKNEQGQAANSSTVFEFQRGVLESGLAYRVMLKERMLLVWCMKLGRHDRGYNFVFCSKPYDTHANDTHAMVVDSVRMVPSGAATHQGGVIGSAGMELVQSWGAEIERTQRTIDTTENTVLIPPSGSNGRRVNHSRRRAQNSRRNSTRGQAGSSPRVPDNRGSARTNRTGLDTGSAFSRARERTPASTGTPNNTSFISTATTRGDQAGCSAELPQENNQPSRQSIQHPNIQATSQNPMMAQPTNGQGIRPTTQNPSTQAVVQNEMRAQPANERAVRQAAQHPSRQVRSQNQMMMQPPSGLAAREATLHTAPQPTGQRPMTTQSPDGQAGRQWIQHAATQATRQNQMMTQPPRGHAARRYLMMRQRSIGQAAGRTNQASNMQAERQRVHQAGMQGVVTQLTGRQTRQLTNPLFRGTVRQCTPGRAQYPLERSAEGRLGETRLAEPQMVAGQPQPTLGTANPCFDMSMQTRFLQELRNELLRDGHTVRGLRGHGTMERVDLLPILVNVVQRGVEELQILYDEVGAGFPDELWTGVRLFPHGPFVGSLPMDFMVNLLEESGIDHFGLRGLRFWYAGAQFLVYIAR